MKDVFVLMTASGVLRGVFTSKKMLKTGVYYWMRKFPMDTLVYRAYMPNYIPGNLDTQNNYAYVAKTRLLSNDMDNVPWGENLVGRTDINISSM